MRLHDLIADKRDDIIARWRTTVKAAATEAKTLRQSEIEDNIPGLLDEIIEALADKTSVKEDSPNAVEHGKQRLRIGFDLTTVVREYGILRNAILDVADEAGLTLSLSEFRRLGDSLTVGITDAVVEYSKMRHRLFEMFASVLSRDLKNPLQAISTGSSMLMRQSALAADVIARLAGQVANSAGRIHRLVDQLVDLSRVGLGGGFALDRQWVDLRDICAGVVEELRAGHPDRDIQLEVDGACSGEWDRERITQVLSNLALNALNHGSEGQPVTIRVGGQSQSVIVSVHNLGNPIPHDDFTTLFDPFRQQPAAPGGSLGLGLYIVREIVREHGGTLSVESSAADGTTFRLELPKNAS
jgi:signal transduction histidine kinase